MNQKNKKSLLYLTSLMIFSLSQVSAQMQFGPKLGLNLANVSTDPKPDPATSMQMGFHIGGIIDYGFSDALSLQAELLLSTKGYAMEMTFMGTTFKGSFSPMYLEIPVGVAYKMEMGDAKLFGVVGPYLGYGLGGKSHTEFAGKSEDKNIEWGSDSTKVNPMDFGLKVGVGAEVKNIIIGVNYGIGLANLSNESKTTIKNMVLGITAGYLLGGK